jgi:hypothetical protein
MFSTCVARGIAAKLVYKTVGSKVEMSLYCSTAAVSASNKQGRKRPDNERRSERLGSRGEPLPSQAAQPQQQLRHHQDVKIFHQVLEQLQQQQ